MTNNNQSTLEMRGEDVEAAISAGLNQLGLPREQVTVEVIDEGRKGFLGLGEREAVVRLTPIPRPEPVPAAPSIAEAIIPDAAPVAGSVPAVDTGESVDAAEVAEPAPQALIAAAELDEDEQTSLRIVRELLAQMEIAADLDIHHTPADELTGRRMTVFNIVGEDDEVNRLIGSRGEVLNDFQYLARLMAGHAIQGRADFILDVNGFREDREQALASLARRMAQKAVRRGRPVTLEPMSPYDRRIIHMTLREDEAVTTQSTGEGNRRRVRIYPKEYADD